MMKQFFVLCSLLLFSVLAAAQSSRLAKQYLEDGDFDKALGLYQQLYQKQPQNTTWFNYMVECHQQLEK